MVSTTPGFLMRESARSVLRYVPLLLALVLPRNADAQRGGLLKKKVNQATAGPLVGVEAF